MRADIPFIVSSGFQAESGKSARWIQERALLPVKLADFWHFHYWTAIPCQEPVPGP